ncbi:OmpW/AlkL family protein [Noviherbaspirillum galbum]|uniref:Outer membrane beta-barrel protein n=1 Tax=Noviherbaspirillum galbum TaxID=2709383 RepID=A0A6B3SII2_9BURK|nr:OmpW family outer membrane protein [Noviherbaspirillum galbum]NEX60664.1 outer membrane beta-barrel protein [Noviherbaspirillum galbum]
MKNTLHIAAAAAVIAGTVLSAASASAQSVPQNTLRLGVAHIGIHSKSDDFTTNGPAFLTPQPAGITVDDANTLVIAYTRRLNANLDLDLILGIPPQHDVKGRGTLAPFGTVSKVKQASPTAFINYNFGDEANRFRPFVGVGLNFTRFYDAKSTDAGNLASGGPTKIELSDSWGLAVQAGLNYKLTDRWSLNGSVATADVKSDLKATTGSIERRTRIDFRPVVMTVSVGYSF